MAAPKTNRPILIALALFAILALAAWWQLSRTADDQDAAASPTGSAPAAATPASATMTVTRAAYIPAIEPGAADTVTSTTSTTATESTATETNPDAQTARAATCRDVIRNGSFDTTSAGRPWTGVATTPRTVYPAWFLTNARAHSGAQSGRVGSKTLNSVWDEMIQTVPLPRGVTGVTLAYWRFLDTAEASRTRAYDVFSAGLETEQGIQIVTPQRIDNTSDGRGQWVRDTLALPNPGAYSGRRLWVTFKGTTSSAAPSALYIDDVSLTVCATGW